MTAVQIPSSMVGKPIVIDANTRIGRVIQVGILENFDDDSVHVRVAVNMSMSVKSEGSPEPAEEKSWTTTGTRPYSRDSLNGIRPLSPQEVEGLKDLITTLESG